MNRVALLILAASCSAATGAAPPSQSGESAEPPLGRSQQPAYRSTALRSPFEPASNVEPAPAQAAAQPDVHRPKEPLEHYSLAQLRLVGTLSGRGVAYALLEDPTGEVHPVAVGDHVGSDHGRVDAVRDDAVALVETVADGAGGWIRRQRSLLLAPAETPKQSIASEAAKSPHLDAAAP